MDNFIHNGNKAFYRFGAAVLKHYKPEIKAASSAEEIVSVLKKRMAAERDLSAISSVPPLKLLSLTPQRAFGFFNFSRTFIFTWHDEHRSSGAVADGDDDDSGSAFRPKLRGGSKLVDDKLAMFLWSWLPQRFGSADSVMLFQAARCAFASLSK